MNHMSTTNTQLVNTEPVDMFYDGFMGEIHERLRHSRNEAKLTQGQVAKYEDLSKSYISKLESGDYTPNVWPLLANLARRYRVSADYLLGLTDNPTPSVAERPPEEFMRLWREFEELPEHRRVDLLLIVDAFKRAERQAQQDSRIADLEAYQALYDQLEEEFGEEEADRIAGVIRSASWGAHVAPFDGAGEPFSATTEEEEDVQSS